MAIIDLNTGELTTEQPQQPIAGDRPVNEPATGGIIDLNTGDFVAGAQQEQDKPAEFGLLDTFTGSERIAQNPELGTLPEFGATEEGDTFKIALGLISTAKPEEQQDIIKSIIPEAQFETLGDGSVIVNVPNKGGVMQRSILNRPGISPQDLTTGIAQVLAFVPAARLASFGKSLLSKFGIGAAASSATEAARQEATISQGSEQGRSPSDVVIAGGLGGLGEVAVPAVQSLRASSRAKAIGAETEEVARAVESIKPTAEAQEGLRQATGVDVPLFQAQQTQIPSELLKQRILPQLDAGARTAARALESQNKAVFEATSELVNTIAPVGSIVSASKRFREASKLAIDSKKQRRSVIVRPLYDEALKVGGIVDLSSTKSAIKNMLDEAPAGSDFEKVGRQLENLIKPLKEGATPTLRQLQKAKISMQDIIDGVGDKAVSGIIKGEVAEVKRGLVGMMEEASPLFKAAEGRFKELAPAVKELEDSILGQVSKVNDTQLKNIAQRIFDPKAGLTDPQAIINARKVINEVDPEAWNQLLRVEMNRRIGGLEQLIEDIPGDFVGNIPGQLRRTLFGNPQQRKALMVAMNEEQKTNFKYLETVLKRASSGRAAGSPTAAFGQAIEKLKGVSSVIRDVIFRPLSTLQQTGERGIFDRNVARLSEVMFDPKFKPQLNKLKKLNPESPAAARAMIQLLNVDSESDSKKGNK